ncbi:MAG: hypothetical protein OEV87_13465 [Phycisphaerae bacterium]|nr:hypothetical protein [Phycisphaerae bacterium]
MDINELFEGIMKAINQYTDDIVGERMQPKILATGQGPENGRKNSENSGCEKKQDETHFPKKTIA